MQSIDEMVEAAVMLDSGKHDHILTPRFDGRRVQVDDDMVPCLMEHQATTHLCGRLSQRLSGKLPVPSTFFNQTCDDEMYAWNLNRLIGRITDNGGKTDWLFRCHDDKVRAVVGEGYPAFGLDGMWENRTLLEALRKIVKTQPSHDLIRSTVDRDRLIAKVTFKDLTIGGEHWGVGAAISNSEVGDGTFQIYGLIKRTSCNNSIVINQGWVMKHIGGVHKFHAALSELAASMGQAGVKATEWLNDMVFSKEIEIPDMGELISNVAKGYGWDEATKLEIGVGTEGRSSVYGLVNGITWAAHRVHGDRPDMMLQMETVAADILNKNVERYRERQRRNLRAVEFVPVLPERIAA